MDQSPSLVIAELRDPLTIAISFMPNPGPFRACNRLTVNIWDHAIYLEGFLPCGYVMPILPTTAPEGSSSGEEVIGE